MSWYDDLDRRRMTTHEKVIFTLFVALVVLGLWYLKAIS